MIIVLTAQGCKLNLRKPGQPGKSRWLVSITGAIQRIGLREGHKLKPIHIIDTVCQIYLSIYCMLIDCQDATQHDLANGKFGTDCGQLQLIIVVYWF